MVSNGEAKLPDVSAIIQNPQLSLDLCLGICKQTSKEDVSASWVSINANPEEWSALSITTRRLFLHYFVVLRFLSSKFFLVRHQTTPPTTMRFCGKISAEINSLMILLSFPLMWHLKQTAVRDKRGGKPATVSDCKWLSVIVKNCLVVVCVAEKRLV